MTTPLTYTTYVEQMALMAVVPSDDANFLSLIPSMLNYAEDRIFRDLDFVFTSTSRTGYALTSGNRGLTVPYTLPDGSGTWVITEQIILSYPYLSGTRVVPLTPATLEFINAVYGSGSLSPRGQPKFFCVFNDNDYIFGPVPDQNYAVELIGTFTPKSKSATSVGPTGVTGTTFLSMYLPELLIMASMIYISAYQRNFLGMSSNSPEMPATYETQYQALLKGAGMDEARKSFTSAGWSALATTPLATPPRN